MRSIETLGHAEADRAIAAARAELARRGETAVIAVADAWGEPIAVLRLDGAPVQSVTIAMNKAFTAARERRPTREIGQAVRDGRTGYDIAYYGDRRFVGWGGGFPVFVDGAVVGAVAVSGLTEAVDEDVALAGVAAITESRGTPAGG